MNSGLENIWAEPLPDSCPPTDAKSPNYEAYFRLVNTVPPTINDFLSTRAEFPERKMTDECIARAVSLFSTEVRCQNVKKLPTLKDKIIYKIELPPECGVLSKTGRDHYSWWRFDKFDIANYCRELEIEE